MIQYAEPQKMKTQQNYNNFTQNSTENCAKFRSKSLR
ncbi:hypothetical protein T11_1560 [Trichinella zimbabwensis]|uniref:Uncharacterized protein n=1 Tax=Trichinella zimbabwensis TaxID=268475 RepID=A0A0V1G6W3_9BILA|nr:hypothetical protein T11_1560 [Trichinella zimbabwensis]